MAEVTVIEGHTGTVATYTKSDPEGEATNWGRFGETAALSGDDADAFEFDKASGRLSFTAPPDYEDQARYEVTLNANDGSLNGALDIVVTVTNLEESGSLTLGAQRGVNGEALEATLTDPDIVTTQTWKWQRRAGTSGPWTDIASTNASSYTPGTDDVNQYLRAHVTYTDGSGTDEVTLTAATTYRTVNDASANQRPVPPDPLPQIDDVPENAPRREERRARGVHRPGERAAQLLARLRRVCDPLRHGPDHREAGGRARLRDNSELRRRCRCYGSLRGRCHGHVDHRHQRRERASRGCRRCSLQVRRGHIGHDRRARQRQRPRERRSDRDVGHPAVPGARPRWRATARLPIRPTPTTTAPTASPTGPGTPAASPPLWRPSR